MLKDHVDYDKLKRQLWAWQMDGGAEPAPIATWRKALAGEVCGGCGQAFREGSPVMEAVADGSIGHAACHTGGSMKVTTLRPKRRK